MAASAWQLPRRFAFGNAVSGSDARRFEAARGHRVMDDLLDWQWNPPKLGKIFVGGPIDE